MLFVSLYTKSSSFSEIIYLLTTWVNYFFFFSSILCLHITVGIFTGLWFWSWCDTATITRYTVLNLQVWEDETLRKRRPLPSTQLSWREPPAQSVQLWVWLEFEICLNEPDIGYSVFSELPLYSVTSVIRVVKCWLEKDVFQFLDTSDTIYIRRLRYKFSLLLMW